MWAIPSLMGRTCNTESPHIHHLCYWQTLYIWYNTFRNGHCFLNSTVLISWYEWWNNPSSCRSQKRWSFSAMQPLPYFPLHGDCLLWFCLICFPTRPPYLPSNSQEFLFHSACCYHWIDDVINIILLLYINSDSDFHITLCSASYCYKTIFITKSWFFYRPLVTQVGQLNTCVAPL